MGKLKKRELDDKQFRTRFNKICKADSKSDEDINALGEGTEVPNKISSDIILRFNYRFETNYKEFYLVLMQVIVDRASLSY